MMAVIGKVATTEPLGILNNHRPFGTAILMSGVVPFVLREWPGRRHSPVLCFLLLIN
jgi:hypothetical protein